ncbi:MAG: hypothetical protein RIQ78_647, partial [Bacteroidota bacterium]
CMRRRYLCTNFSCVLFIHSMKYMLKTLLLCCFCAALTSLYGQNNGVPELLAQLGGLHPEQRSKVLEYTHYLGAFHGKSVEASYLQLSPKNQHRVFQFIAFLTNPGKPEPTTVRWTRDTLSFGSIEEGFILMDSFTVINTGNAPYTIESTKSSCSCTVLRYPTFPVMPGDTATIRVEFDSMNKAGHAQPGIILFDNSRPNKRNILYLDGTIEPRKTVKTIVRN